MHIDLCLGTIIICDFESQKEECAKGVLDIFPKQDLWLDYITMSGDDVQWNYFQFKHLVDKYP